MQLKVEDSLYHSWFMINLLPPEEKKGLLTEETKRLAIILGFVFLSSLFCLIIILGFLKIYLLIQIDIQKSTLGLIEKQAEISETQAVIEKIEDSNQKLVRINNFYEQRSNLEEALEELTQTIPEGIYLTDLSYSKNSSQIILAGFSPSQDLLVQFKKNLEQKKEEFPETYFPVSSWSELLDIDFIGVIINLKNENSN